MKTLQDKTDENRTPTVERDVNVPNTDKCDTYIPRPVLSEREIPYDGSFSRSVPGKEYQA